MRSFICACLALTDDDDDDDGCCELFFSVYALESMLLNVYRSDVWEI